MSSLYFIITFDNVMLPFVGQLLRLSSHAVSLITSLLGQLGRVLVETLRRLHLRLAVRRLAVDLAQRVGELHGAGDRTPMVPAARCGVRGVEVANGPDEDAAVERKTQAQPPRASLAQGEGLHLLLGGPDGRHARPAPGAASRRRRSRVAGE